LAGYPNKPSNGLWLLRLLLIIGHLTNWAQAYAAWHTDQQPSLMFSFFPMEVIG